MRDEQNAPIKFDRVHGGYYYAEPTYQLPLVQLTQGELLGLYLSERMLRQFQGTPFEPDLRQAIAKLTEMLPDHVSARQDDVAPRFAERQRHAREATARQPCTRGPD